MNFKDQIALDRAIFLNSDEFGELHIIDGMQLSVVLDDYELQKRKAKAEYGYNGSLIFYVSKSALGSVPAIGQIMNFDGEIWRVMDVQDDAGLLTITLESNMS